MTSSLPAAGPADFAFLDAYLMTVFRLLEGIADIEQAAHSLSAFLASEPARELDPDLEEFLYELFFDKCRKYWAGTDAEA